MTYQLTTLPNGLRIASEHMPSVESVAVTVSIGVGSRYESEAENGLSHILEHMAFKGTTTRSAQQIAEAFEDIGGQFNAYTSVEQTVYYARVLSEHMPRAVELLADILQHSVLNTDELKREQQVITQEIAMHQDSPEDYIGDVFDAIAYPNQPMGRSILGNAEQIQSYSRDAVMDYMHTHYHAPRMVISAAGKISHHALLSEVQKHFALPQTIQKQYIPEPARYAGGEAHLKKDFEQTHLLLGYPSIPLGHPDFYALQLLAVILGGGMSSRLFQEIREKRGMAYQVSAYASAYSDAGMLLMSAASNPAQAKEIPTLMKAELEKIAQEVGAAELERSRNQQLAELVMARENSSAVAGWIGRHLLTYGEYITLETLRKRVHAVQIADIKRLADALIKTKPTLATLGN
jgi:predicted Zn-dependent peptidase